jgi:hypothetical protein
MLNWQDDDWHPHNAITRHTLTNGDKASGLLMRRKRNGKWEYRRPTPVEESEYVSSEAW